MAARPKAKHKTKASRPRHGREQVRGKAPTVPLGPTPRKKSVDAILAKARRAQEARAAKRKAKRAPAPFEGTWADAAARARAANKVERAQAARSKQRERSEQAPTPGGPWHVPQGPFTWAQVVADSKKRLAQAKRDEREAKKVAARAAREAKRAEAAVKRAREELADRTGRKAKARGEKKLKEQLRREQTRLARIEHEHKGTISQYDAMSAWFVLIAPGATVGAELDGTVNGILELPGLDEPEQLTRAIEDAIENVPVGCWIRIGWKFRTDESRRYPAPTTEKDRGRPGYDGKWYANVMSPWYPPHQSAQAVMVACDDNAPHGSIFHNMLSPEFNHQVLGAVIECHYTPLGEKPDRR